ncbi:hypothetical protein EMPS_09804 [Entomortierella parvispora]|uniref:Crinkler effector protein N-terminal domain-containing protein n=1 Tax=Entomortierella parvispora TaxID=205924 RepID=A0A9P3HIQ8_9FUNG|nr:hypothetical protein EMPS_09804 [Entomortierella parvispora]
MAAGTFTLYCLISGKPASTAFKIRILNANADVDDLRDAIFTKKSIAFDNTDADDLILWRATIPTDMTADKKRNIMVDALKVKTELDNPRTRLSRLFPESPDETTYVVVERPKFSEKRAASNDQDSTPKKRIRLVEEWKSHVAFDGMVVDLPSSFIGMLNSPRFKPEPRRNFAHLLGTLTAGEEISAPSLGQKPKDFGLYQQPDSSQLDDQPDGSDHNDQREDSELHRKRNRLFVTNQMLELWEDMAANQPRPYRRVLSGPMGVGKSYLSYFLAARAYAKGWLVLYVSDAQDLKRDDENLTAFLLAMRFIDLNKDVLTGADLETLVDGYDGVRDISRVILSNIFDPLLRSEDRKSLLLIDEHGKLFEDKPYWPVKYSSLVPLQSFGWWGELATESRVIFTGTAHAKFEMTLLEESYRKTCVVFVGPLSKAVFLKILATHPRLDLPAIRDEVLEITNCVPRELVYMSVFVRNFSDPLSVEDLKKWMESRASEFFAIAKDFNRIHYEWDFLDLGLVYRTMELSGTRRHILCQPAQKALLKIFRSMPIPEDIRRRIDIGMLTGDDFETALFHQLVCATK